ncbi:putative signal peptide protein [Puccinia sorghi]|uniref:Putative signal peptide protein n=1 Tax=Puccinia sorghi TaxID=27349 RepID=A0A0L6V8N7_9BASI|nr:putative signal peptide protein [Puccinia sorghi]
MTVCADSSVLALWVVLSAESDSERIFLFFSHLDFLLQRRFFTSFPFSGCIPDQGMILNFQDMIVIHHIAFVSTILIQHNSQTKIYWAIMLDKCTSVSSQTSASTTYTTQTPLLHHALLPRPLKEFLLSLPQLRSLCVATKHMLQEYMLQLFCKGMEFRKFPFSQFPSVMLESYGKTLNRVLLWVSPPWSLTWGNELNATTANQLICKISGTDCADQLLKQLIAPLDKASFMIYLEACRAQLYLNPLVTCARVWSKCFHSTRDTGKNLQTLEKESNYLPSRDTRMTTLHNFMKISLKKNHLVNSKPSDSMIGAKRTLPSPELYPSPL